MRQAHQEDPVLLAGQAQVDPEDPAESEEEPGHPEAQEYLDDPDLVDQQDRRETAEYRADLVHRVLMGSPDRLVLEGSPVSLDLPGCKVDSDPPDPEVNPDQEVVLDQVDHQERWVDQDLPDLQDRVVNPDRLAELVVWVASGRPDREDNPAHLGQVAKMDHLVEWDPLDQEARQDPQEHQEILVRRVRQGQPD